MYCPSCRSHDILSIGITPAGRAMTFSTCRSCEHKWWVDATVSVELGLSEVLSSVAAA